MAALPPPVAAVRAAVGDALALVPAGGLVIVACSGGPDSLALAAAAAFVAPRAGRRAGLVTVDHGLQAGSAERAKAVASWALSAGLHPVEAVAVEVPARAGGPEAAARQARYEALATAARAAGAAAVLLGHTRDDQAETVLLALARGSGPRGIAGMPAVRAVDGLLLLRPLLDIARTETAAACAALDLPAWQDPHNVDPAYARSRVRAAALPALVGALGPDVVANLARTATLVAADNAALDRLATRALAEATDAAGGLRVPSLLSLDPAVRGRALLAWARGLGAPGGAMSHRHVAALDALVTRWRGQGPVHLPGGLRVARAASALRVVERGGAAGVPAVDEG